MDQQTPIGVEWQIVGGKPGVQVQIVLQWPGHSFAVDDKFGPIASMTLEPQAAHTLALLLKDKAEAAARKAGVILENKLGHEST